MPETAYPSRREVAQMLNYDPDYLLSVAASNELVDDLLSALTVKEGLLQSYARAGNRVQQQMSAEIKRLGSA
jgi:hypothetical protein